MFLTALEENQKFIITLIAIATIALSIICSIHLKMVCDSSDLPCKKNIVSDTEQLELGVNNIRYTFINMKGDLKILTIHNISLTGILSTATDASSTCQKCPFVILLSRAISVQLMVPHVFHVLWEHKPLQAPMNALLVRKENTIPMKILATVWNAPKT